MEKKIKDVVPCWEWKNDEWKACLYNSLEKLTISQTIGGYNYYNLPLRDADHAVKVFDYCMNAEKEKMSFLDFYRGVFAL